MQIVNDLLLPLLASHLGRLPLTTASFDVAGFAVAIDGVLGRPEGIYAGLGAFRIPEADSVPPVLRVVAAPGPLVRAGMVEVDVAAEDDLTPPAFARFSYRLDGAAPTEPAYGRRLRVPVSTAGPHAIEIAAYDLNGNPSAPQLVQLEVDAQPPTLSFTEPPPAVTEQSSVTLRFQATDDRTAPGALAYRWQVLERVAGGAAVPRSERDFGPLAEVPLSGLVHGAVYEVTVTARDEAGNVQSQSLSFAVNAQGGCTTAAAPLPGRAAGAFWLLAAALCWVCRRVRSRS